MTYQNNYAAIRGVTGTIKGRGNGSGSGLRFFGAPPYYASVRMRKRGIR